MMSPYRNEEVFNPLDDSTRFGDETNRSNEMDGIITLEDPLTVPSSGKSTILGASFNFINSIIGAGIIGMPFAIYQCGFFMGIFLLALVAYLNYKSVIMLIECGLISKKLDLEELSQHYLGDRGYYLALSVMFLFAFGGQIAYMVIIGDTIPAVAQQFISSSDASVLWLTNRKYVTAIVAVVIMLPLCLMRELSSFSWFSFFSILSDSVITVIIMICAPGVAHSEGNRFTDSRLTLFNINLFAGIGAMSFAFVCQHNSFMVFKSLKKPTNHSWQQVALISVGFSFGLILAFGSSGYLNFGSEIRGDLLTNFPPSYAPVSGARLLLAMCMTLTYPLENYVAKHCLYSMYIRYQRHRYNQTADYSSHNHHSSSSSPSSSSSSVFTTIRVMLRPITSTWFQPTGYDKKLLGSSDHSSIDNSIDENHLNLKTDYNNNNPSNGISPNRNTSHTVNYSIVGSPRNMNDGHGQSYRLETEMISKIHQELEENEAMHNHSDHNNHEDDDDDEELLTITFTDSSDILHGGNIITYDGITTNNSFESNKSKGRDLDSNNRENEDCRNDEISRPTLMEHVIITLIVWTVTALIAIFSSDLSVVLALTGAIAASNLGYVIPGLVYIETFKPEYQLALYSFDSNHPHYTISYEERWYRCQKFILPIFMIGFGIISMIIGMVTVFVNQTSQ